MIAYYQCEDIEIIAEIGVCACDGTDIFLYPVNTNLDIIHITNIDNDAQRQILDTLYNEQCIDLRGTNAPSYGLRSPHIERFSAIGI